MYNIYKKYSNTYNYISEVYLDNFSKEAAEKLPKEYIEEIQKKTIMHFLLKNKVSNYINQQ